MARADRSAAAAAAQDHNEEREKDKDNGQRCAPSAAAAESSPGKRAQRNAECADGDSASVDKTRADALTKARDMVESVKNDPTPSTSPPPNARPDRATASDRASAVELNQLKETSS